MENELSQIINCLNESEELSKNKNFLAILQDIQQFQKTDIQIENYKIGSFTINQDIQKNYLFSLSNAISYLNKNPLTENFTFSDLVKINKILTENSNSVRTKQTSSTYPFPKPELIDDGIRILFHFYQNTQSHILIKKIAFIQGMLSLHPFHDGNHRTFRLLLDYWLQEMNVPCMTLKSGFDFIFANPTDQKVFLLENAVEKVLICIGNTIQNTELNSTYGGSNG